MKHPTADVENEATRTAVEVMRDSIGLYEKKNDDYGDSWQLAGKTLAMWLQHQGHDELRIPATEFHMNSLGLFTRRLDKMIREWNGWMCLDEGESFRVDESIVETHQDDVPYAAMHTQLAEEYATADIEDLL
jgi:hypothetical protein